MFERYTEKARRVIFFARYEASHYGSPFIETEHLLLGIMREYRELAQLCLQELSKQFESKSTLVRLFAKAFRLQSTCH